ncbi:hypothetical protein F5B18DRAFT_665413 [Nemania serpens]|nr:hypothetical protein F5B18DRAFT_665413 [Nemania serpens]
MSFDTLVGNHGHGPQNVVAGCGPQSNLNGAGTQNNYYGSFRDPRAIEAGGFQIEKEDCLRSLSFPNMNVRRETIDDAHPDTCDWLFSTAEFEEWLYRRDLPTHNGVFWIKGKPGAGKSTLMNHTLSYYERIFGDHLIVAYFFNARGGILEKSPMGMMRSIVYQLLNKDDTLCRAFLKLYRDNRRIHGGTGFQWRESELKKFMRSIAKQPQLQLKPLLLLVDALDECAEEEVRDVVKFIETLSINAVHSGVELRICLSSRHYPGISMKKNIEITLEGRAEHGTDITTYIQERLNTQDSFIEYQVRKKAGGIFMWVVLVVAMLNKSYDEGRHEAMQKTLDEVPEDLEALFNSVLEKGDSDKTELIRMLQWVLFAQRRLTPEELYIAAVGKSLPSREVIRRRINSSSKGLIEIRGNNWARLETLDPTLQPDFISASHARLWAGCRSYLQDYDTTSTEKDHVTEVLGDRPLLKYAAIYILAHADEALASDKICAILNHDMAQWLEAPGDLRLLIDHSVDYRKMKWELGSYTTMNVGLIHILLCGRMYQNLLSFAIDKGGVNIHAPIDDVIGNALQVACFCDNSERNHEAVELLLEKGADVNANSGHFGNALQVASYRVNFELIKLLLRKGADVNKQGGVYGNALQTASLIGSFETTKLLLEKGADVNKEDGVYGSALQGASLRGSFQTTKLLLEKGADVNKQGGFYGNALQAASSGISLEIVHLLIENGADINIQGGFYGSALKTATHLGYQQSGQAGDKRRMIVRLLLEKGAKCDPSDLKNFIEHSQKRGIPDFLGKPWSPLWSLAGLPIPLDGQECPGDKSSATSSPC